MASTLSAGEERHAVEQGDPCGQLPRGGRGRRRDRRRRGAAPGRDALGTIALDRPGWGFAQLRAERTARRRVPPSQPVGAAQGSERRHGLDHHGAGGYAAHVRLQRDLRGHGPARDRHPAHDRAGNPDGSGSPRRAGRSHRPVPRRQGRADHRAQRAVLCGQARRPAGGRGPGQPDGAHRLWRRQLRHGRRRGARLRHHPGRGARDRRHRHAYHPGGQ